MDAIEWLLAFPGRSASDTWMLCHHHVGCSVMGGYHVLVADAQLAPTPNAARSAAERGLRTIALAVGPPGTRYFWAPPDCLAHCRAWVERTLTPDVPRDPHGDPIPPGWRLRDGGYDYRGVGALLYRVAYSPLGVAVPAWRVVGGVGGRSDTLPGAMCIALGLPETEPHLLWDPSP